MSALCFKLWISIIFYFSIALLIFSDSFLNIIIAYIGIVAHIQSQTRQVKTGFLLSNMLVHWLNSSGSYEAGWASPLWWVRGIARLFMLYSLLFVQPLHSSTFHVYSWIGGSWSLPSTRTLQGVQLSNHPLCPTALVSLTPSPKTLCSRSFFYQTASLLLRIWPLLICDLLQLFSGKHSRTPTPFSSRLLTHILLFLKY